MRRVYKLMLILALIFSGIQLAMAAPDMPSVSSGATEHWYQIVFQRNNAELVLQDNGDGAILTVQTPSTTDATEQLWKIEAGATSGKYILTSKGGRKLYWDDDDSRFKASSTATATELTLVTSTNTTFTDSYELQRNGETLGMNPNGGSTAGNQMGETTMADGGNCLRFVPQGLASQVRLSAGATEYWYNVEFINNGNVWLKDNGEDAIAKTDYLAIGADNMLWKVEAGSTAGYYKITSKAGRKLYWDGTSRFKASASPTATDVTFITNGVVWEIQRTGTTSTLNPNGGSTVGNEIGEYTKGDIGSRCRFVFSPFKVSDNTNTYWYRVVDNRATPNYWYTNTYSENANTVMFTTALPTNKLTGYFKFMKNATGNGYLIYGASQPTVPIARKENRLQADGTAGEPMYITPTPLYTQSRYIIKREATGTQYNSFGDDSYRVWEYNDVTDAGNQWKFIDELTTADIKTDYNTLRTDARKLYNYTATGTYFGRFPAADRVTYLAAIVTEEAKNADTMTDVQLIEGYNALFNAIATYKSKVITDVSTITSTAESPKWFYISNNATNSNASYAFAKVMTSNGVTATGQNFKFETKAGTDAQYWRFEAVTGGVRIINKAASGYEFGDPTAIAAGSGTTYIPAIYTNDVVASITLAKSGNNPLHAQNNSSVIVKWGADVGNASLWTLQAKDENLTNGTAVVPVVSTVANPVYYYIFSAADGRVGRAGSPDATTPYDFRAYALISPAADGFLKWGVPAGDNALWAIVDVGGGVKKLYNKGTGKYMHGSHSQNGTGEALTYTPFASPNDLQYEIKSGSNNFVIPYNLNTANRNTTLGVFSQTAWYFVAPTYTGTGDIATANNWSTAAVPASQVAVIINGDATVNADASYNGITINSGKSLTVAAGKKLSVPGSATNSGTIKLLSDATGTATLVGNVGGTAEVQQYLASSRNWYMSSPVSGTATVTGAGVDYYTHSESDATTTDNGWSIASTSFPTVEKAQGFIVKPSAAGTITFTGTLNNADVTRALTRTADTPKPGFNLVGNPFTAYLPWTSVWAVTSNQTALSEGTMWYRTVINNMYTFATVNAEGVAVTGADNNIPPMQAFWVRASATAGDFTLNKSLAAHSETANMLKAPAASSTSFPMLRMVVSNRTLSDEAIVYFSEKSSNDKDANDASKMFNGNSIPEIYTLLNGTAITINSMNSIPYNTEISLGFRTQNAGEFTLTASEFSNFAAGEKVILRDKVANKEIVLSDASYSFTAEAGVSDNRFTIMFPKSDVSTSTGSIAGEGVFAYARNQRIVVNADAATQGAMIYVFNSVGQRVASQAINGLVNEVSTSLPVGVYVVKVNNHSTKVVVK